MPFSSYNSYASLTFMIVPCLHEWASGRREEGGWIACKPSRQNAPFAYFSLKPLGTDV